MWNYWQIFEQIKAKFYAAVSLFVFPQRNVKHSHSVVISSKLIKYIITKRLHTIYLVFQNENTFQKQSFHCFHNYTCIYINYINKLTGYLASWREKKKTTTKQNKQNTPKKSQHLDLKK